MESIPRNEGDCLPIGAVAALLGISVQTLRMYERRGLILAHKGKGNQRVYSQSDIERLKCIRAAIIEHKISIEGIRRIQSMIPCWATVNCSPAQREVCPAYTHSEAGCWTYRHGSNVCAGRDCRDCQVYLLAGDCVKIKQLVHRRPEVSTVSHNLPTTPITV